MVGRLLAVALYAYHLTFVGEDSLLESWYDFVVLVFSSIIKGPFYVAAVHASCVGGYYLCYLFWSIGGRAVHAIGSVEVVIYVTAPLCCGGLRHLVAAMLNEPRVKLLGVVSLI